MPFGPIISNPAKRAGLYWDTFKRSKDYTKFFVAAKQIVRSLKLPSLILDGKNKIRLHELLAVKLEQLNSNGGLRFAGTRIAGKPSEIAELIHNSLAEINPALTYTTDIQTKLAKIIVPTQSEPKSSGLHPIQRLRAFGTLLQRESQKDPALEIDNLRGQLHDSETLRMNLTEGLHDTLTLLPRISGRTKADFIRQENVIYRAIAANGLIGMEMGDGCESLVFKVVGPNGEKSVPRLYVINKPGISLAEAPLKPLIARGFEKEGDLSIPLKMPIEHIDSEGNKYLTVSNNFSPRRDYIVMVEKDGSRHLYRKEIRSGDDLCARAEQLEATFEAKLFIAKMRKIFKGQPNAFVELVETSFDDPALKENDIIPVQLRGTKLSAVAVSGKDMAKTINKLKDARQLQQQIFEKLGIVVPMAEHPAEYTFGLVGEAFVKPFQYFIKDGDSMIASKNPLVNINEALRKAAAGRLAVVTGGAFGIGADKIPRTFYVGSGDRTNDKGHFRIANVFEVTNPEITPETIDPKKLEARFRNGLIYTTLAACAEYIISEQVRSQSIMLANIHRFLLDAFDAGDLDILKGSFKDVSIGFIDLKSSTAMCRAFEKKGAAEDYSTLIRKLLGRLKEEVESQGINVVLLKYIGDCIMFVSGIPYQGQGDHGSIIRTAIAMKRANKKLNADPGVQAIYEKHRDVFQDGSGRPTEACFCTGIMSGTVFAGDIFHKEIDYRSFLTGQFLIDHQIVFDIIGDPVNLAARHEASAGAWHILINMATIDGAKKEGSLQPIIDDFNSYATNTDELRDKLLIPYYQRKNRPYNLKILNEQLAKYLASFKRFSFDDLSTPCIVQGKGTGLERAVYFHWDIRPIVLERLRSVNIETPGYNLETQPPSISDILAKDYSEISPSPDLINKLQEYVDFIGLNRIQAEADLITDQSARTNVVNNLAHATKK